MYRPKVFLSPIVRSARYSSSLPASCDAVVIGGGVVGASTAFHLAKRGIKPVVLERDKLTSGTSWHSAAMINTPKLGQADLDCLTYTRELAANLEEETGVSTGWVQNGGLTVTRDPVRMQEFQKVVSFGRYFGQDYRLASPDEIQKLHPLVKMEGILGGIYAPTDGYVDPTGFTNSYMKGAKSLGATVVENSPIQRILVEDGKVVGVATKQGTISTKTVILCAGAWSRALAAPIGVTVPLLANRHWYVATDIVAEMKLGRKLPNLRIPDDSIYYKAQNETLQVGGFEPNPTFVDPVDPDLTFGLYDLEDDVFEPMMKRMLSNMDCLKTTGTRALICGPESFTPDGKPLVGESNEVKGLYLNCGLSSKGMQMSGGVGREIAALIADGCNTVDGFAWDPARFGEEYKDDDQWRRQGCQEAQMRFYWPGVPHVQRFAGRNLIKSPLHDLHTKSGAFFGQFGGYEIPHFFLPEYGAELAVPEYDWYGHYGHEKREKPTPYDEVASEFADWSPTPRIQKAVSAEAKAARNSAAVFDLSAMGKISVSGTSSLNLLQRLCSTDIDLEDNNWVYTLMLNESGGIEAELVVLRESRNSFLIMVGSAVRDYLHRRIVKYADGQVRIADLTKNVGAISIQGPKSKSILTRLPGFSAISSLKHGQSTTVSVDGDSARVLRLGYVGEVGYEIHAPAGKSQKLAEDLLATGKEDGIRMAGMQAMMDLHLESGYRHWHGDVDCTDSPYETGLMTACHMEKDFVGKDALQEKISFGPPQKMMVTFTTDISNPLNGSEVVYRNGSQTGYVVRSGRTHRNDRCMGNAYVSGASIGRTEIDDNFIKGGEYEIEVFGRRVPAQVHMKSVYEPKC